MFGKHHCTLGISKQMQHVKMITEITLNIKKYKEIELLQTICISDCFVSWVKYNSNRNLEVIPLPELNAVLPIILKKVHTLAIYYRYMKIIKRTVNFLNPGQTLIHTCY